MDSKEIKRIIAHGKDMGNVESYTEIAKKFGVSLPSMSRKIRFATFSEDELVKLGNICGIDYIRGHFEK